MKDSPYPHIPAIFFSKVPSRVGQLIKIEHFLSPYCLLHIIPYMTSPVPTPKELTDGWGWGTRKQMRRNSHTWESRWGLWDFEGFCSSPNDSQLISAEQSRKQGPSHCRAPAPMCPCLLNQMPGCVAKSTAGRAAYPPSPPRACSWQTCFLSLPGVDSMTPEFPLVPT